RVGDPSIVSRSVKEISNLGEVPVTQEGIQAGECHRCIGLRLPKRLVADDVLRKYVHFITGSGHNAQTGNECADEKYSFHSNFSFGLIITSVEYRQHMSGPEDISQLYPFYPDRFQDPCH